LHQNFFVEISQKKIQIELNDEGNGIKVAIDGEPLFEMNYDFTSYDDFYQRKSDEDYIDGEEESSIAGSLTVHKKNRLNNWSIWATDFSSSWSDPPDAEASNFTNSEFYKLFVQETEETLTLNGIRFEASRTYQTNFVNLNGSVDEVIFPNYERLKLRRPTDQKYQNFVDQYFARMEHKDFNWIDSRRKLYNRLVDISKDLNKGGFKYEVQL
jgi:hypothetical protein